MAAAPDDGWDLAGAFRLARSPRGWVMTGGEENDEGVVLDVVVSHPDDDELVRRYRVRVPLTVGDDGLAALVPTVERA